MDKWITLTEQNWAFWVAGLFALFEFFRWAYGGMEWLFKTFGIETKKMREQQEWLHRLEKAEKAIEEIKANSDRNVEMFLQHEKAVVEKFTSIKDDVVKEVNSLHIKLDEHKADSDKTDCVMLRDRIASGMRYFSQNKGEDGNVHIPFAEYVNMDALFQEYFIKDGNGPFHKMYEQEFKKFIIDR